MQNAMHRRFSPVFPVFCWVVMLSYSFSRPPRTATVTNLRAAAATDRYCCARRRTPAVHAWDLSDRDTHALVVPRQLRASNLEVRHKLRLARLRPAFPILQLRRLGADLVKRGDAGSDEHVPADHRTFANHRFAAKY